MDVFFVDNLLAARPSKRKIAMTKNKQTQTMSHKKNAHASARVSNKPCAKMHKTNAKDINFPGRWLFVDNLARKKLSFFKKQSPNKKTKPKKRNLLGVDSIVEQQRITEQKKNETTKVPGTEKHDKLTCNF